MNLSHQATYMTLVFKAILCLPWSESVDESVNLVSFPFGSVSFHTEKNPSKPKCSTTSQVRTFTLLIGQLGSEQERRHRKKGPEEALLAKYNILAVLFQVQPRFICQLVVSNC